MFGMNNFLSLILSSNELIAYSTISIFEPLVSL